MNRRYAKNVVMIVLALVAVVLAVFLVKGMVGSGEDEPVLSITPGGQTASAAPTEGENTPQPTPLVTPAHKTSNPNGSSSVSAEYYGKKLIAITFDDGPRGATTAHMLDELKKRNVPATFFINGENWASVSSSSNVTNLKRMVAEGHEIGNHTWKHSDLKNLSDAEVKEALNSLNNKVKELVDYEIRLFRPPYGKYSQQVLAVSDMTAILWNIDSEDWRYISDANLKKYAAAEGISQEEAKSVLVKQVADDVVAQARHGAIILFHDVHPASADAAMLVIDELQRQGYVFLTVSDLILTESESIPVGQAFGNMWGLA